jgi:polyphosphate glucokinase
MARPSRTPRVLAVDVGGSHVKALLSGESELGHLAFRKKTFEDYVSARALERRGKKKWREAVFEVVDRLTAALEPDTS